MLERLTRARIALEGLSVGDAPGERFFGSDEAEILDLIRRRELPDGFGSGEP